MERIRQATVPEQMWQAYAVVLLSIDKFLGSFVVTIYACCRIPHSAAEPLGAA